MTEQSTDNTHKERSASVTRIDDGRSASENGERHMERLATTFESSARRWEMIVYPSLFAFIVLASYGFFLIYSLTSDVASLARNVSTLTQSIDHMVVNMDSISGNMVSISGDLNNINGSMNAMNDSTRSMAMNVDGIRHQVGSMNHNIGRPMSQMSSFIPW
jgi:predicted PurR-regulated permease PerM